MLGHFVNLVVQSFISMPSRVGSNWGGVIFSVVLFCIAEGALMKWGSAKVN